MVVYKIKNNDISEIRNAVSDSYTLQADEYGYPTAFELPQWNGSEVVEGITPEIQAERAEFEADRVAQEVLAQRERDGERLYLDVYTKVKRRYDDATLSQAQYKNIRSILAPALQPLKWGDWDLAKDNIDAIRRPSGGMGVLYDYIKGEIDSYVLANY